MKIGLPPLQQQRQATGGGDDRTIPAVGGAGNFAGTGAVPESGKRAIAMPLAQSKLYPPAIF
jgi:hypothetical protein